MLSILRLALGRGGRLLALAALVLVSAAGSASAALPTSVHITTQPHPDIRVGESAVPLARVINFDATSPAGGTMSFFLCSSEPGQYLGDCPTGGDPYAVLTNTGGPIYGPRFTPTRPGFYCFRAEFSGTTLHSPSSHSGQQGCIAVRSKVTVTYSYSSPPTIGLPFSVIFDVKDEQGLPVPGQFTIGDGGGCGGGGPWSQTVTLVNGKATTAPYTPMATGGVRFSWQLASSGYSLLASCTSAMVGPAPTTSNLALSASSVNAGQSVTLTNTVTAPGLAGTPQGAARFWVCGPGSTPEACVNGMPVGKEERLVNGVATDTFKPTAAGFYCFRVDYLPGIYANFSKSSDGGTTKCVQLATAGTGMSFFVFPEGDLGEPTRIWARVTRPGGTPTGSVQFARCGPLATPAGCPNPTGDYSNRPQLYNGQAEAAWFTPQEPGYYCLWAKYEGDDHTPGITEDGPSGCFEWNRWKSSTTRVLPPMWVNLKGGQGPTGRRFKLNVSTAKAGGAQGSVAAWVCGPLPTQSGCKEGGKSLGSHNLVSGSATSDEIVASGVGYYCVRAHFTSSDGQVHDSTSGSDADGQDPSCINVGLGWKNLELSPLTKVEGDPDPAPRLVDHQDPSIFGEPECGIAPHPETPGTYEDVVWCDAGTLTSPFWYVSIGQWVSLTITPKPKISIPDPDPKPNPNPNPDPPGGTQPPIDGGPSVIPDPPPAAPSNVVTITKLSSSKGAVTLALRLPGAGRVLVTVQAGKKRVTRSITATKPGPLTVKFTARQLKKLTAKTKKGKKIKLKVTAQFTPTGGTAGTAGPRTVSLKVK